MKCFERYEDPLLRLVDGYQRNAVSVALEKLADGMQGDPFPRGWETEPISDEMHIGWRLRLIARRCRHMTDRPDFDEEALAIAREIVERVAAEDKRHDHGR